MKPNQEVVYRHAMRIEAVRDIGAIGRGGFWEDLGYEWYAGI